MYVSLYFGYKITEIWCGVEMWGEKVEVYHLFFERIIGSFVENILEQIGDYQLPIPHQK